MSIRSVSLRELVRIRSRTQPAPTAVLDDGAWAFADDRVAASLQRQQERGLPCAGAACDYYSRHAEVPRPCLRRLTTSASAAARHDRIERRRLQAVLARAAEGRGSCLAPSERSLTLRGNQS
jgi:hypothetical protein